MKRIVIHGAAGRMGKRLVALTLDDEQLTLAGATEAAGSAALGEDAGQLAGAAQANVAITESLPGDLQADALIDFTVPASTRSILSQCVSRKLAMVIGTTGLTDADHAAIDDAAEQIPILQAPNMSLGVNLLFALAGQVAARLGDSYDIEIVEAHHRFKKDAPSGTALGLAEAICNATGKSISDDVVYDRHGDDVERQPGQIGMHALRMGDTVGQHTACFAALGERIELSHTATTRDVFAHGALNAAKWLASQKVGRYTMADVLGL
jgi:4-hydroxy-tetrahydrodipicolinate reductase